MFAGFRQPLAIPNVATIRATDYNLRMRFRRSAERENQDGPWFIEVDFGDGWAVYGPALPTRAAAEVFAYDLRAIGRTVRIAEGEVPPDTSVAPRRRRTARKPSQAA